jgi:pimeloyl-ACP methyl ester carboxylesterase
LDLRGNGRSQWTPDAYRLQDFVQDKLEFVEQLATPVVLVGHSIGGVIALMVASRCRNKVKAVVVEDSPLSLENYRNGIEANRAMYAQWLDLKKSAQTEQDLALRLGAAYLGYPGVTSAWLMFFAGCLWQLDPTYFNVLLRDLDTGPVAEVVEIRSGVSPACATSQTRR